MARDYTKSGQDIAGIAMIAIIADTPGCPLDRSLFLKDLHDRSLSIPVMIAGIAVIAEIAENGGGGGGIDSRDSRF